MKPIDKNFKENESIHSRTEALLGAAGVKKLADSRVIIFGIGGVGGFAAEALARAGVGHIALVDNDTVSRSNINRQIIALSDTVGLNKTEAMAKRIHSINPDIMTEEYPVFYSAETASQFDFTKYDYVIDAIDCVSSKLLLIEKAHESNTKIICCMGAGNKLDPTMFEVARIDKTSVCPLARVIRTELRKRNLPPVKVVYSKEEPKKSDLGYPGSISFVPSVAGLILAGEVVKDLAKKNQEV
ncbi:MAG: tRNA threonylcarbamoyladenosine dehydratase [Ruminococcaceae bacterium]|nr:tRNA threonylcarbamoyladenosine dehydratase [Oscillospiraceae bacterium]